jgi:hypothetical protein
MTTRRDLLRLASALGLAGATPTMAERIAAMTQLNQRASANILIDPGAFAVDAGQMLSETPEWGEDWIGALHPECGAKYMQARKAFLDAEPAIRDAPVGHPFNTLDDAVTALVMVAYDAGVRHGAAYEHLRRMVIGDLVQCRACWGVGATEHEDVCPSCGGTGTVAMKA